MSATQPPRVTVVIPARNAERHLAQALESVVAQTYEGWEAVVVDDASSDRTYDVAVGFERRRPQKITVIRLTENVGVPTARNLALESLPRRELVALLDSDDYWRKDYLERSLALHDSADAGGRKVGVVACNPLLETPDGILGETFADRYGWTDPVTYDDMIERNCIQARAVFSRAAYDEVGGFSPDCAARDASRGLYAATDDYDMWLRIMEAGYEVVATRETLAVYRIDPAGASRNPLMLTDAAIALYTSALGRGRMTSRQRRAMRSQIRHYRALRERALLLEALRAGRVVETSKRAVRAAPWGLLALLQRPSRWGEWARDLARMAIPRSRSAPQPGGR